MANRDKPPPAASAELNRARRLQAVRILEKLLRMATGPGFRGTVGVEISAKDEAVPGNDPYPHTTEEIEAAALVNSLSYKECEELFAAIRHLDTEDARALARQYRSGTARP